MLSVPLLIVAGPRDSGPLWMWKVTNGTGWNHSVLLVRTGKTDQSSALRRKHARPTWRCPLRSALLLIVAGPRDVPARSGWRSKERIIGFLTPARHLHRCDRGTGPPSAFGLRRTGPRPRLPLVWSASVGGATPSELEELTAGGPQGRLAPCCPASQPWATGCKPVGFERERPDQHRGHCARVCGHRRACDLSRNRNCSQKRNYDWSLSTTVSALPMASMRSDGKLPKQ